jgi:hypothetical protein
MYQSISESLTKTAYLKMIDFWLIFCLLIPFIILLTELFWMAANARRSTRSGTLVEGKDLDFHRKVMRLVIPIASCLFVLCFATIAFVQTYDASM